MATGATSVRLVLGSSSWQMVKHKCKVQFSVYCQGSGLGTDEELGIRQCSRIVWEIAVKCLY